MTSTEIVQRAENGREREWIALLEPAAALAKQVAGTGFVPKAMQRDPAAIVAAILYGDELGLGPMQALAKISVIEGKPTLSAEAQRALVLAAGHELWLEESSATRVTVSGRRFGSDRTSSVTWTLDDAKRAGLAGRQNWRSYPRQMLTARATAELARMIFADVIGGLAATEELEDVDPLDLPVDSTLTPATTAPTTTKRRRRKAPAEAPPGNAAETGEEAGATVAAPDLPPLPDEPVDSLVTPAVGPEDESLDEIGAVSAGAENAEEVTQDEETTASSGPEPDSGASSADTPTEQQVKALNSLVGRLRETSVDIDGVTHRVLSTPQLWAALARGRNIEVDVMINLLGGTDDAGVLHWSPLRDSLTKAEASDLIGKLEDRAKRWGVE